MHRLVTAKGPGSPLVRETRDRGDDSDVCALGFPKQRQQGDGHEVDAWWSAVERRRRAIGRGEGGGRNTGVGWDELRRRDGPFELTAVSVGEAIPHHT